ncbi:MAG: hypothetical protein KKD99_13655 [Proteobacteria bacterium]|nr:hypothetical protein [Pseudomonadota bacterium]
MQKEPKLPDDAQNLPAKPTIPAGPPEGAPAGEPHMTAPGGCPAGAAADPRLAFPGGWSPYPPGMMEEDEINLLDLFIVLLKHKWMIFWVVFLAGVAAVVISLLMTNIYRSEATIAPTTQEKSGGGLAALGGFGAMIAAEVGIGATGSLEQFDVVLKSRDLTNTIIREKNLLPVIFDESWDVKTGKWKEAAEPSLLEKAKAKVLAALKEIIGPTPDEKEKNKDVSKNPTLQDAYKPIQDMLSVKPDKKTNVMQISFESKDPEMARTILNYYIVGLSEFLRRQTLEDAAAQQVHLTQQLSKTTDPLLKNRLYELIAKQIEKETLAKIQRYYSFNVIDPAFVPEKKFKPKRAQICMISVVVAFFIAIFLAFFMEYVKNLKTREDPERLANLRNAFGLRRRP